MDLSGLVFVGIVAVWAAYLIPSWMRRRNDAVESRRGDRFSPWMRLLHRRPPSAHPVVRRSSAGMLHTPGSMDVPPAGSGPAGPSSRGPGRAGVAPRPTESTRAPGACRVGPPVPEESGVTRSAEEVRAEIMRAAAGRRPRTTVASSESRPPRVTARVAEMNDAPAPVEPNAPEDDRPRRPDAGAVEDVPAAAPRGPRRRPDAKPAPRPAAQPAVTAKVPVAKPQPTARPVAQPQPTARPVAKPQPASASGPAARPQPTPRPAAKPQPAAESEPKPQLAAEAAPAPRPAAKSEPGAEVAVRPATQRPAASPAPEPVAANSTMPPRSSGVRRPATGAAAPSSAPRPATPAPRRVSAARRRAQILVFLLVATVVVWLGVKVASLPTWTGVVVTVLLVLDLIAGRMAAVQASRRASLAALERARRKTAEREAEVAGEDMRVVPSARPMDRPPAPSYGPSKRKGAAVGRPWSPTPVPQPAYMLKPKAPDRPEQPAAPAATAAPARPGDRQPRPGEAGYSYDSPRPTAVPSVTGPAATAGPTRPTVVPPLPASTSTTPEATSTPEPDLDLDAVLDRRRAVNG